MAIQQTKKQSDLEKRLRLLRQQVYGRRSEHSENSDSQNAREPEHLSVRNSDALQSSESFRSDITYLYQDLTKILFLTGLALGAQIILFFLSRNHILNFNFF